MKRLAFLFLLTSLLLPGVWADIVISVVPGSQIRGGPGESISVLLKIAGLGQQVPPHLGAYDLSLGFNPIVLSLMDIEFKSYLGDPDFQTYTASVDQTALTPGMPGAGDAITGAAFTGAGLVNLIDVSLLPVLDMQPSSFVLAQLDFLSLAPGTSPLDVSVGDLGDENGNSLLGLGLIVQNGTVQVTPEPGAWVLLGTCAAGILIALRRKLSR